MAEFTDEERAQIHAELDAVLRPGLGNRGRTFRVQAANKYRVLDIAHGIRARQLDRPRKPVAD